MYFYGFNLFTFTSIRLESNLFMSKCVDGKTCSNLTFSMLEKKSWNLNIKSEFTFSIWIYIIQVMTKEWIGITLVTNSWPLKAKK
jgi:hypothetical protein